ARALLAPLLAERGGDRAPAMSAVGHAHIDLGWLWPVRESRRKVARTLATVMRNLAAHPDYVFGISQPQQLAWVQQDHPALFAQVQAAVAVGRIECQGGMWVESDTNLVSAESLARQLLYGQRAWQGWFGQRVRTCWLPDVFGYSAALPQILAQAGIDRFMTIKLSWSKVNRFPHHTFRWRSPDGSEVLAHMPPEGTYNSSALPRSSIQAAKNFQDASRSGHALLVYGIGDGGGGPGQEHLERLERCRDLAGMPAVRQESSERFFERIAPDRERLSAWSGELYLECHQGTLTSQGRMKMANRRLEWALRRAELAASRAWLAGAAWPGQRLASIWRDVLLHQFHDILPGSSIRRVYVEAEARSAEMLAELDAITAMADAQALPEGVQVVNDLSWPRAGWVRGGRGWHRVEVGPCAAVALPPPGAQPTGLEATADVLSNGILRATFAADGRLASLVDLEHGREALSGPGNDLIAFDDPGDAWDFPADYRERAQWRPEPTAVRCGIDGPEAWVERTLRLGSSTIVQRVVLADGSRRLEFRTRVDWQERGRMLRVRFPAAVHAEAARCEIAVGSIARPTHANTSWDAARFEVPVHSWVDLSERGYGVALLNDGKYGHRLDGDVLDLALLRSPSYPDPEADRGEHAFTYAIYPHAGDHVEGRVTQEAHDLNAPLRLATGGSGTAAAPLVEVDADGVLVTAVKRSEDGDLLVVRLMEVHGATTPLRLRCCAPVAAASLGTLLEDAGEALPVANGTVALRLPPWSLRTVLLHLGRR
ncbi:MAG: alpha-mannosidase, partial [Planctomycetes bacterium]|nr:alpha-mannosidase [Planctomycetota bacterium]